MKCYIVAVGEPSNCVGYEYEYHVFMKEEDAEAYFDKVVKQHLADGEYSADDLEEMQESSSANYYSDINGEWVVHTEEGILGE